MSIAMRELQDLGFAVEEVSVSLDGDHQALAFQPKLVAAGYHQARLRELTGLETEELQAKRLLASFDRYRKSGKDSALGICKAHCIKDNFTFGNNELLRIW